jgi:hypothetical protein
MDRLIQGVQVQCTLLCIRVFDLSMYEFLCYRVLVLVLVPVYNGLLQ